MRVLSAFALGFAAVAVIALVAALSIGVVADASGWSSFELALGPLVIVEFERTARAAATTVGAGIAALALAGGVLNALGAAILQRRV